MVDLEEMNGGFGGRVVTWFAAKLCPILLLRYRFKSKFAIKHIP